MNLQQITAAWALPEPLQFRPIDLGFFNLTSYVDAPGGTYVLRLFRRTGGLESLRREQALLADLQRRGFPLALPAPIPARSGAALVAVDGGYASLMACLPGAPPNVMDLNQAYAYGTALGEMTLALQGLVPEPVTEPYGALEAAHHLVPDPWALPECLPPEFQDRIRRLFADLREQLPGLYRSLPQQVIHGDFVARNALMQEGRVTGVLDFEFCAHDLRAMDLAIALGGRARRPPRARGRPGGARRHREGLRGPGAVETRGDRSAAHADPPAPGQHAGPL